MSPGGSEAETSLTEGVENEFDDWVGLEGRQSDQSSGHNNWEL